ncbi:hypothetical protein GW17_00058554 [Ensete ventricosum]|nr:hypothetical protein GW17_00058554 [Ensete ventricosum]
MRCHVGVDVVVATMPRGALQKYIISFSLPTKESCLGRINRLRAGWLSNAAQVLNWPSDATQVLDWLSDAARVLDWLSDVARVLDWPSDVARVLN